MAGVSAGASAQEISLQNYVKADGTATTDLDAATRSWMDNEFNASGVLSGINAQYAYADGYTGKGIKIGIFDTGVDATHPEFAGTGKLTGLKTSGTYAYTYITEWGAQFTTAGQPFNLDGGVPYWSAVSGGQYHGTHVGGIAAANRDGSGMQGVAFGAALVAANSADDGPEAGDINSNDANVYTAGFDALRRSGVRVINNSWGIGWRWYESAGPNGEGLIQQYAENPTQGTIEAMTQVAKDGILVVMAGGEDSNKGGDVTNALPFFKPQVEDYWISVAASVGGDDKAGWADDCGLERYYCIMAPGDDINSSERDHGYARLSGTSMAAPAVSGSLAVLMERYPYLENKEIRQVLLTTASHRGAGPADVPNTVQGWGEVDLQKGMNGPGQFLGTFTADLPEGVSDIWSNPISDTALKVRNSEDAAAVAAWESRKASLGLGDVYRQTPQVLAELASSGSASNVIQVEFDAKEAQKSAYLAREKAGVLVKEGAGRLILSGDNSYTGGTTISGGVLQIGAGGTTGSIVGDVVDNATLAFNRADATRFGDTISGNGGLVQAGSGTLTLTGQNTYTGQTTVTAGSLAIEEAGRLASPVFTRTGTRFDNAGIVTGSLTNAGTAVNSGTLTKGVINSGTLTSTGAIAGGLVIDSGSVTVAAGLVDGGISNIAGHLAVTGTVSSNGALDNAAWATTEIAGSGRYSLTGIVANAGSLTLASGGSLNAPAGVFNAGTIRVEAGATLIDSLTNGGVLLNAGTYVADAVNLAGATLTNTGTFTTVSRPIGNAGTLISTGVVNGGIDNAGQLQVAGQLNGSLSNAAGASAIVTGPLTGIGSLVNDGALDLGGANLTVGSLGGQTTSATLGNGHLTTGADNSSGTYAGQIVDGAQTATSLTKQGTGLLTLSGQNTYTGPTTVDGGTLFVSGSIVSPTTVNAGATFGGSGTVGDVTLNGGRLVPGALRSSGSLALDHATLVVGVSPQGASTLAVNGAVQLNEDSVSVEALGLTQPFTQVALLSAAGGITGRFAALSASAGNLNPFLRYGSNDITLTLDRNDIDYAAMAATRNQRNVAVAVGNQAGSVQNAVAGETINALYANSEAAPALAQASLDRLSGEGIAGAQTAAFEASRAFTAAIGDEQMAWQHGGTAQDRSAPVGVTLSGDLPSAVTSYAPEVGPTFPPLKSQLPQFAAVPPRLWRVWGAGFGGSSTLDGSARIGTARQNATFSGGLIGLDYQVRPDWLIGAAIGGSSAGFDVAGRATSGSLSGAHAALYSSFGFARDLYFDSSVSFAGFSNDLRRTAGGVGALMSETEHASFDSFEVRLRGELGKRFGYAGFGVTPFAAVEYASLNQDGFNERSATGGAGHLSLHVDGRAISSLPVFAGMRLDTSYRLDNGATLRPFLQAAFVHEFDPQRTVLNTLVSLPDEAFLVQGARAAANGARIKTGFALEVRPDVTVFADFNGEFSHIQERYAGTGGVRVSF